MLKKVVLSALIMLGFSGCLSEYNIKPSIKSKVVSLQGKCLNFPSTKEDMYNVDISSQETYVYLAKYSQERGIEVNKDCKNITTAERYQKPVGRFTGSFSKITIKVDNIVAYQVEVETDMDFNIYDYQKFTKIMFDILVKENNL